MSAKNLDQKGRLRSKLISFRMSPEEHKLLDRKVLLSGYTKQDYIISCILKKRSLFMPILMSFEACTTN